MSLIDEIILQAADDQASISGLLRKCLVLAHQLGNQSLKEWAAAELNGYDDVDALPSYRIVRTQAKGLFIGSYNRVIDEQPIPPSVLEPKHREFAERAYLRQPIASYQGGGKEGGTVDWPADLVVMYQHKFFQGGDPTLNRAWLSIPGSVMAGLNDIVRTKLLQLALELKDEMEQKADNNTPGVAPATIDRIVNTYIFGGNNVIATEAKEISQVTSIIVNYNDLVGLSNALRSIGIHGDDVAKLENAISEDAEKNEKTLGAKSIEWIAGIGKEVGREGLRVSVDVAKAAAMTWIKQHIGVP